VVYDDISLIKGVKEKRYIHVSTEYDRKRENGSHEKWESPQDIHLEINASLDKESI
jgi:hypothetical protein